MSARNEKIIDMFLADRTQGDDLRRHHIPKWRSYGLGYMNKRPRRKIPNEFFTERTTTADEFRMIETTLPQHLLNMFRTNQWMSVFSASGPGDFYESLVKNLLLTGWAQADLFAKSIEAVKYNLIYGHLFTKLFWDVRVGPQEVILPDPGMNDYLGEELPANLKRVVREVVTYNGPSAYLVDLMQIIVDPTGRNRWAMERLKMPLDEIEYEQSVYRGALYDDAELNKLKKTYTDKTYGGTTSRIPHYSNQFPSSPVSAVEIQSLSDYVSGLNEYRGGREPVIWQYWKWVSPNYIKYDDSQWRMYLIADDKFVLRDVKAPTPNSANPYISTKGIPIPGRLYGESVLYWTEGIVNLRAFLEDARREEVIQKLWQPMIVDESASLSPEQLFRKPGGMLFVGNTMGDLAKAIIPLPQQDVMPSAYNEPAVKEDQMNRIAGATDPFQGAPVGGRATATEVSIITQLGSSRFQLATMWMDETYKRPLLKGMFEYYRTRMTQPQVIELTGRERYPVDFRMLAWDVDIRVDSGFFGSADQAMLQTYLQLYGIFANNPRAEAYLNHGNIIHDAFVRAGDPRVERHVRSEEHVNQLMAAQAEQAQQQQQAEVQNQQSIDANRELARGFASSLAQGSGEGSGGGIIPTGV